MIWLRFLAWGRFRLVFFLIALTVLNVASNRVPLPCSEPALALALASCLYGAVQPSMRKYMRKHAFRYVQSALICPRSCPWTRRISSAVRRSLMLNRFGSCAGFHLKVLSSSPSTRDEVRSRAHRLLPAMRTRAWILSYVLLPLTTITNL